MQCLCLHCRDCGETRLAGDFHKQSLSRDGLDRDCKACRRKQRPRKQRPRNKPTKVNKRCKWAHPTLSNQYSA